MLYVCAIKACVKLFGQKCKMYDNKICKKKKEVSSIKYLLCVKWLRLLRNFNFKYDDEMYEHISRINKIISP